MKARPRRRDARRPSRSRSNEGRTRRRCRASPWCGSRRGTGARRAEAPWRGCTTFRHVPPSVPRPSTQVTFSPSCAPLMAATYPPGPPPITTTSCCSPAAYQRAPRARRARRTSPRGGWPPERSSSVLEGAEKARLRVNQKQQRDALFAICEILVSRVRGKATTYTTRRRSRGGRASHSRGRRGIEGFRALTLRAPRVGDLSVKTFNADRHADERPGGSFGGASDDSDRGGRRVTLRARP